MTNLLLRTRYVAWIATLLAAVNTALDLTGEPHVLETPIWTAAIVVWSAVLNLASRRQALEIELASREQMRKKILEEVQQMMTAVETRLNDYERRAFARVLGSKGDPDDGPCLRSVDKQG